jgi:ATP-dependent helicase Lhr and Lhr-like helicase
VRQLRPSTSLGANGSENSVRPEPVEGRISEDWVAKERAESVAAALSGDDTQLDSIILGWMESLGPTTAASLAACLGLPRDRTEAALIRNEAGGRLLRGQFTPGTTDLEFCERGLLARIHRLTLGRLRREIEPVSSSELIRFLSRWQRVQPGSQLHGPQGLLEVIGQLQGFPVAAGAWERDVLPARVAKYDPAWLDQLCMTGEVAWGRLTLPGSDSDAAPTRRQSPTRAAPVALVLRRDLPWLLEAARAERHPIALGSAAAALKELLAVRGASFLGELVAATGRLEAELTQGLWELVAAGQVTCDGFAGLRTLMTPVRKHEGRYGRRRPQGAGGRWSLFGPPLVLSSPGEAGAYRRTSAADPKPWLEPLAAQYLRRYGIVFRDLLLREPTSPPWRELLPIFRRLEARGELRGGRFVAGYVGEQFALPAAVDLLRAVRRQDGASELVDIGATDPLNLVGILTPGSRVPSQLGNRVAYANGVPVEAEPQGVRTAWQPKIPSEARSADA